MAHTSILAARQIAPHAPSVRERVFEYIKSRGIHGATIDECAIALGLKTQTVCGRFNDLQGKPSVDIWSRTCYRLPIRIKKSDELRKTSSGRDAQVWVAA